MANNPHSTLHAIKKSNSSIRSGLLFGNPLFGPKKMVVPKWRQKFGGAWEFRLGPKTLSILNATSYKKKTVQVKLKTVGDTGF